MLTTGLTFVRLMQGLLVLVAAGYPVWRLAADPGDETRAVTAQETARESRLPQSREDWYRIEFSGQPAGYELVTADMIDEERPWRHDSAKLAAALMDIYVRPDP